MVGDPLLYGCVALVIIGLYSIASRRNLVKIFIGLELVTVGVNLGIVFFGRGELGADALAQSMALVSIAIGASVAALMLAVIANIYRHYGTLDVRRLVRLRG